MQNDLYKFFKIYGCPSLAASTEIKHKIIYISFSKMMAFVCKSMHFAACIHMYHHAVCGKNMTNQVNIICEHLLFLIVCNFRSNCHF